MTSPHSSPCELRRLLWEDDPAKCLWPLRAVSPPSDRYPLCWPLCRCTADVFLNLVHPNPFIPGFGDVWVDKNFWQKQGLFANASMIDRNLLLSHLLFWTNVDFQRGYRQCGVLCTSHVAALNVSLLRNHGHHSQGCDSATLFTEVRMWHPQVSQWWGYQHQETLGMSWWGGWAWFLRYSYSKSTASLQLWENVG